MPWFGYWWGNWFGWNALPAWIALLNFASAVLLMAGWLAIRRRRVSLHRGLMLSAFATSLVFLAVYLLHHWHTGVVYYHGIGWRRVLYFALLGTHTPLAAAVPVLALVTLGYAWRGSFRRHRRWARWTWPIWMYVSLTGIAVYWMLYHA